MKVSNYTSPIFRGSQRHFKSKQNIAKAIPIMMLIALNPATLCANNRDSFNYKDNVKVEYFDTNNNKGYHDDYPVQIAKDGLRTVSEGVIEDCKKSLDVNLDDLGLAVAGVAVVGAAISLVAGAPVLALALLVVGAGGAGYETHHLNNQFTDAEEAVNSYCAATGENNIEKFNEIKENLNPLFKWTYNILSDNHWRTVSTNVANQKIIENKATEIFGTPVIEQYSFAASQDGSVDGNGVLNNAKIDFRYYNGLSSEAQNSTDSDCYYGLTVERHEIPREYSMVAGKFLEETHGGMQEPNSYIYQNKIVQPDKVSTLSKSENSQFKKLVEVLEDNYTNTYRKHIANYENDKEVFDQNGDGSMNTGDIDRLANIVDPNSKEGLTFDVYSRYDCNWDTSADMIALNDAYSGNSHDLDGDGQITNQDKILYTLYNKDKAAPSDINGDEVIDEHDYNIEKAYLFAKEYAFLDASNNQQAISMATYGTPNATPNTSYQPNIRIKLE